MQLKELSLSLPDVRLFEPVVFGDTRGYFLELFSARRYRDLGLPDFVQDNLSWSSAGCLRGLHMQWPAPQGKLITALQGEVFDVAVDLRRGSPTFKRWLGVTLSEANHHQLYIPPGFAHGFCVTSATALIAYKATDYYTPSAELGVRYDDPEMGIEWPVDNPVLSPRDAALPLLSAVDPERLAHI